MRVIRSLATLSTVVLASAPLMAQSVTDSAVVFRGASVPAGAALPVTALVASARNHTTSAVLVEGVITRECTEKGCWMQVAPSADASGMRVTFKDYAFFIPQSMVGRRARMHGITTVTTHSKASTDHLIAEGAKLTRNPDGTSTEVAFEASGVELRR